MVDRSDQPIETTSSANASDADVSMVTTGNTSEPSGRVEDQPRGRVARTLAAVSTIFALVLAVLLIPIPFHGRMAIALGDMAHAPLFGAITLAILLMIRTRMERTVPLSAVLAVAVTVCLFGVGIEIAQSQSGRMASVHDAVANTWGIFAAVWAFYAIALRRRSIAAASLFALIAAGILLFAWLPPLTVLYDVVKARTQFPMLATFESAAELGRFHFQDCRPERVEQDATEGRYALAIRFYPASDSHASKYPGARLHEFPSDWSDVRTLELDVILDAAYAPQTLDVMLKVVSARRSHPDRPNNHFWKMIPLKPNEPRHLRFTRQELIAGAPDSSIDLGEIVAIDLIAIEPPEPAVIRVDAIRLTLGSASADP